jgi:hypothetical protein
VKYFKKLLSLALAPEYFPKLALNNNRIFYRRDNGTLVQLEDDHSTQALMDYLNPSLNEVEQQELISCARMVHWAMNDPEHIKVQVETGIGLFRENIKTYAKQYNLDNAPDKVCLVICDIRHQGRAKNYEIFAAMNTGGDWEKAFNNLLDLGSVHYPDRIKTLKSSVSDLIRQGILGKKKYSISVADFIDL